MIRAPIGSEEYWSGRIKKFSEAREYALSTLTEPEKNPGYAPQFWFDQSRNIFRIMMLRYSRGDQIADIHQYFPEIFDAWERSNALSEKVCVDQNIASCRDWSFKLSELNHYNWCFWLIGVALAFEVSNEQWSRLLTLIDGEGQDVLIDRIVVKRSPNRKIGKDLLHAKPYRRLLKTIDAPQSQQAQLLYEFVENWYPELFRKGKDELWWYVFGDPKKNPLETGSYFGRWCIEAVAAVKSFGLDDCLCLGQEHYPSDLLRGDGEASNIVSASSADKSSWLGNLLRRKRH